MPLYQYALDQGQTCDRCPGRFDELQKIADPVLKHCPRCGKSVHRELCAPAVRGKAGKTPTASEIAQAGFTQYKKAGNGVYEKTAGKGPDTIKR